MTYYYFEFKIIIIHYRTDDGPPSNICNFYYNFYLLLSKIMKVSLYIGIYCNFAFVYFIIHKNYRGNPLTIILLHVYVHDADNEAGINPNFFVVHIICITHDSTENYHKLLKSENLNIDYILFNISY